MQIQQFSYMTSKHVLTLPHFIESSVNKVINMKNIHNITILVNYSTLLLFSLHGVDTPLFYIYLKSKASENLLIRIKTVWFTIVNIRLLMRENI